jgi:isoleucyl-tRNA synthetase
MDAQYIPGWDCHGLPIENAIEKAHGRNLLARRHAGQEPRLRHRADRISRWPTSNAWACWATGIDPYRTMDFANEAGEIRAFKRVMERGFVYRGLKPVYWCFDCGSSLAEFEIEYADKKSQTLDVAFPVREPDKLAAAFGLARLVRRKPLRSSGPPPPGPSRPTRRSTSTPS